MLQGFIYIFVEVKKFFCIGLLILLASSAQAQRNTVEQYIAQYKDIAVAEMYRAKIPASITLAQALLESDAGNSTLSKESANHFGIKCKKTWQGKRVYHDDDTLQECFRAYDSVYQSYKDHSDFLMSQPRYAFLFSLEPTDYKGWAYGLKKAGYATNPQYPEMLIAYIEKYQLQRFDTEQPSLSRINAIKEDWKLDVRKEININETPGLIAKEGDTWQLIATENDMRVWQILRYNDLEDEDVCKPGDTVFLKPKRNKASEEFYIVPAKGESMHAISQRFGIKLKKLYHRNLMEENEQPIPGEKIYLNETREQKPKVYKISPAASEKTPDPPKEEKGIILDKSPYNAPPIQKAPEVKPVDQPQRKVVEASAIKEPPAQQITEQPEAKPVKDTIAVDSNHYIVQKKDNLYRISMKFKLTVAELKQLNNMQSDSLKEGSLLLIRKPTPTPTKVKVKTTHKVIEKETIYGICKKYGITEAELRSANQELLANGLKIGQELVIPENKGK